MSIDITETEMLELVSCGKKQVRHLNLNGKENFVNNEKVRYIFKGGIDVFAKHGSMLAYTTSPGSPGEI